MTNAISTVSLTDVAGVLLNDRALLGEWFFLYLRLNVNIEGLYELALAYSSSRNDSRRSSFSLFKAIIHQWIERKGSRATVNKLAILLRKMQHGIIADELVKKFPGVPVQITMSWKMDLHDTKESVAGAFRRHFLSNEDDLVHVDESIQRKTGGGVKILDMIKEPRSGQPRVLIYLTQLLRILSLPEVQDIPVVVVSINGRRRAGKSFLSTQFVKYLKFGHLPNNEWLDVQLESNFEWRQSRESVTSGIQVWHDPIVIETDGKKVAVILMDTQGLHDKSAGTEENAMIFALSSLLSSVFIYNEKNDAAEDSLQYLHHFLECAKLISGGTGTNIPKRNSESEEEQEQKMVFQKLILLLRDFEYEQDYAFGYHDSSTNYGQANLLSDTFNESAGMHKTARATRRGIKNCFKDISLYAMAGPGNRRPDQPGCEMSSTWDPQFQAGIIDFITQTLSPKNLLATTKKVFGKEVTGIELRAFAYRWAELVRGANFESRTILETTVDTHYNNKIDTCTKEYLKIMTDYIQFNPRGVSELEFNSFHEQKEEEIVNMFCRGKRFGGEDTFYKFKNELLKRISREKEFFLKVNEANAAGESERASKLFSQKVKDVAMSAGFFLGGVGAGAATVVGAILLL